MIRTLSLTLALAAAATAQAADRPTRIPDAALKIADGLRERALADDTAWNFTEGLTTEIGPRLAASDNDAKAREWVAAKFKALGFDKVWTEPVTYPKWVRRSEHASIDATVRAHARDPRARRFAGHAERRHRAPKSSGSIRSMR